ncbi:hypothetical protein MO973_34410 [Paenibacillus sp. TRM 82003]|nr:hypothetical protein [Paenibacillus sp. TRM 82003]
MHADARAPQDTDWRQVLALYDHLLALLPTPVVVLNRAVALAEVEGPAGALAVVEGLDLPGYPRCTPSAPTCCADWDSGSRPSTPTTRPSGRPATTPSALTPPGDAPSSRRDRSNVIREPVHAPPRCTDHGGEPFAPSP